MNNKFIPIDFVEISDFVIINDNQIEIPDIENKEENIEKLTYLYEELYNTGTYTNSVVIDQSKEIDISKIKEIRY